jgi:hypothetical protein
MIWRPPEKESGVMSKSMRAAVLVLSSLVLLAACSSKPSNAEVEAAVSACLQKGVPASWLGNLLGGKNVKIGKVEIQEWGYFNKQRKYWPVKVRVVGTAQLDIPLTDGTAKPFDKVADFHLWKDEYGKWQASLSED